MPLKDYLKKRNFKKTSEPEGGKPAGEELIFVIHKHRATRLHYDLRLESGGVLKSWAVPKGISMNPEKKHLAVQVEDHPYDYKDFEGVIPEGNYGAGEVMIWDEGIYKPVNAGKSKEDNEKIISDGLSKGRMAFILEGKKLKGEFALVRFRGRGENNWLLIKARDEYADGKIGNEDISARSGKKMNEIKGV